MSIYNKGATDERAVWQKQIAETEKLRDQQVASIEEFSKTTLDQQVLNNIQKTKELQEILNKIKNKPLTNVPCTPSTDFIDAYNSTITRGNKK
jgi:hypothetical protein